MNKWIVRSVAGVTLAAMGVAAGIATAQQGDRGMGRGGDGYYGNYEDGQGMRRHGRGRGEMGHRGGRRGGRGQVLAMFDIVDANGDGSIDATEAENARAQIFAAMDADSDGKVTGEELVAFRMRMRAESAIARLDKDGDGALSIDEAPLRGQQFGAGVMRFDLDEDGVVTKTEMELAMQGGRGGRGGRDGRGRFGPGPATNAPDGAETPAAEE